MRFRLHAFGIGLGIYMFVVAPAAGQPLVSRQSQVNYNYVYGAGGDTHVGNDSVVDAASLLADQEHVEFSGYTEGVLPGEPPSPYTAGVSGEAEHVYSISGSLSAIESITASGSSVVSSATSGAGVALMNSVNPGNLLTLYFTTTSSFRYRLEGSLAVTSPGFASIVSLEQWNGIFWGSVYTTLFQPDSQGPFDVSGALPPGEYRMVAMIGLQSIDNETESGSFNYTLSLYPRTDMNCDGKANALDIQAFVKALLDPAVYATDYPNCNTLNGDINNDSVLDVADVEPFAQCIVEGGC